MSETNVNGPQVRDANRRTFLSTVSSVGMACGLVAGYGAFAAMAGRFLYPSQPRKLAWVFVGDAASIKADEVVRFETPIGQHVTITRRGNQGTADDFLALSTVCPHLGCQVHWESQNNRFFCPCHNGVFDPSGKATAGPPAEGGQVLPRFPLRIDTNGLIFIEVPVDVLG
jgi:cytochrome b6-f complex iron-sulfur subunit